MTLKLVSVSLVFLTFSKSTQFKPDELFDPIMFECVLPIYLLIDSFYIFLRRSSLERLSKPEVLGVVGTGDLAPDHSFLPPN